MQVTADFPIGKGEVQGCHQKVALKHVRRVLPLLHFRNSHPTMPTNIRMMPHSQSSEHTPASDVMLDMSQTSTVKAEPDVEDVAMADAPLASESKAKANLEALFDNDDSDDEFPSSAPVIKEESSQPAPMYGLPHTTNTYERHSDQIQKNLPEIILLRPRDHARLLPTIIPFPPVVSVAQSLRYTLTRLHAPRVRFHASQ